MQGRLFFLFILITRAKRNKRINQHYKGELKEPREIICLFIHSFHLKDIKMLCIHSKKKIVGWIKANVGGISQDSGSLVSPPNLMWREEQRKDKCN